MKYFKLFEQFNQDSVNESKASDAATKLMDIADQGWDKFGFKSADDVYDNVDKQKQYADLLDAEIKKADLAKTIYANADKVHDQLEDDNYHHLNAYLALAGYYTPRHQKSYQGYIKGSTSSSWSSDLFEAKEFNAKDLAKGAIVTFKDGETWIVTKVIGNSSDPRGYMMAPYGKTKEHYISMQIEFNIKKLEDDIESVA